TCSSSWAAESDPPGALQCAWPSPRSRLSTDPECDSRKLSAVSEFSRFQSLCHLSNPSQHLRKERTGGKPQAALLPLLMWEQPPSAVRAQQSSAAFRCYCTISAIVPAPTV